jgi:replicative DNA helicase
MTSVRLTPDTTWVPEFYFLAAIIKTPRYITSVEQPHELFSNKDLLSVWRMLEQAVHLRGPSDPMLDVVSIDEVRMTSEFKRATHVEMDSLWPKLIAPTISGAPERFHRLVECYAAIRTIDRAVVTRVSGLERGDFGPEEALADIQKDVVSLHARDDYTPSSVRQLVSAMWEDRFKRPRAYINTGFPKLDDTIGALVPGCSYLWAARTSHGKSSWVSQVVNQQALNGYRVGVISLEDDKAVWAARWTSKVSGVGLPMIRDNVLSEAKPDSEGKIIPLLREDEAAIEMASKSPHLDNICIVDAKGARLVDLVRIMNDLVVRKGCEVIWLDYIQAIYARTGDGRSRRDFLEYCWAMLEREAQRLEVPLMMTAQLNREWEKDPLPSMPGLRHTEWLGAAEQKCYVGAVIYRPYKDPRVSKLEQRTKYHEMHVSIEKSKQGETVAMMYEFDPIHCSIIEK